MRGPESVDFVGSKERDTQSVDRDVVLNAILRLKGENKNVDLTDINDPEVKKVYDLFVDWTREMGNVESAEQKLILYLQEHMLMYDAGLVNAKEALIQLDRDLEDQLEQIKGDSFIELEQKIHEYRKGIAEKLKMVD